MNTAFIVTLHLYIGLCPVTTRSRRRIKHLKMRKIDLCLSSEGAEVILATSSDEKHPPENMIDGNPETFWTTTGMFPQEFIICFHKHVRIERLIIQSYFVRTLKIEKSTSKEPVDFEPWIERAGIPGWRSGLAPAFGPGRDPGDPGSNPTSGCRCMEPAPPSACVSASLSLSLSL
ncbi:intraflagellar transport protein 25 homolog isoform X1 [Canis aureus]